MTHLADHLAELTEFRDRDALDATLVGAFHDLLRPLSVAVYRCVGEAGNQRWLARARMGANDVVATADAAWTDIDSLPAVSQHPERWEVFTGGRAVLRSGETHLGVFPVNVGGDVGVLEFHSATALDDAAQRLIRSVLRIYCNFQALLEYSERDSLTGLLNRKTFDTSFLKATAESAQASPIGGAEERRTDPATGAHWLGVIDIDHFKRVNDTFGHLIGDEVLLLLARLMRNRFRVHDRLYRFGGEEFVVLMRCESQAHAAHAFERFRLSTEAYSFPQVGRITVSIGFTAVTQGDTPSAAFERADKAVYHAKGHGRNQVCSHAALVASGHLTDGSKVGDVELF